MEDIFSIVKPPKGHFIRGDMVSIFGFEGKIIDIIVKRKRSYLVVLVASHGNEKVFYFDLKGILTTPILSFSSRANPPII